MRHLVTLFAVLISFIFGYLAYQEKSNIQKRASHLSALEEAVNARDAQAALEEVEKFYATKVRRPSVTRVEQAEMLSSAALKLWITRDALTPGSDVEDDAISERVMQLKRLQETARLALEDK